jgi:hypothetical protein
VVFRLGLYFACFFYLVFILLRISTPDVYAQSRPAPWLASWFTDIFLFQYTFMGTRMHSPEASFWPEGVVLGFGTFDLTHSSRVLLRASLPVSSVRLISVITEWCPPGPAILLPAPPLQPLSVRGGAANYCAFDAGGYSQQCAFYLSPCEASGGGAAGTAALAA